VLQTGFGLGEAFLARWQAWRQDPERPARLQVVAIEPRPVALAALQQHLASTGDSSAQAQQLCAQWWGLAPGFHRLGFEGGQVELTLCVGELPDTLRELQLEADSVWLSAPSSFPSLSPPFVWDEGLLKALARLCRRGSRLTSDTDTPALREGLGRLGFALQANTSWLQATYQPAWEPRRAPPLVTAWPQGAAREAVVIGGGLSGLGTAHALARRGWQVTVLDACAEPAGGASGLPAGLFSPHVSPDDNRISRLTRTGLRITRLGKRSVIYEIGLFRAGSDTPATLGHFVHVYVGREQRRPLPIPDLIRNAENVFEYPMVDRDPLPQWTHGRMTLLGDAAHPMYPIGSNGASQAVLDARILTREIAEKGMVPEALEVYEADRRSATSKIVLANRADGPDKVRTYAHWRFEVN
jgi:tRNA U34 5-methylaminomethyl-2-thiouridine-forming methyltransferase MnmC